jgi:riboflavin kinase / FMN adenylyltransferase
LLEETGVDATLMLTFDLALSELLPEVFVSTILVGALKARVVMVGADFRFGAKGAGTVDTLRELGVRYGFDVDVIDEVVVATGDTPHRASSTFIRQLLSEGKIADATELLGHLPTIRSVVVRGMQRGRAMGYPTANLSPAIEGFIPSDGVYAAWLTVNGTRYGAAVSIGNNPTFDGVPEKQVEAHVLDQDIELYGETVELSFVEYIRQMVKFAGVEELIVQMTDDERRIRTLLGYPERAGSILTV